MGSTPGDTSIGLAELIAQVRQELIRPEMATEDKIPLLSIEEIELQIAITVSKTAKAGINIQVIELGGYRLHSDVHTVRVKLAPLLTREERLSMLREDPRWSEMVEHQIETMFKGPGAGRPKDRY